MCEDRSIWEIEKGRSKCGLTFDKIWLDGDIILAGERVIEQRKKKKKKKKKRKGRINLKGMFDILNIGYGKNNNFYY